MTTLYFTFKINQIFFPLKLYVFEYIFVAINLFRVYEREDKQKNDIFMSFFV